MLLKVLQLKWSMFVCCVARMIQDVVMWGFGNRRGEIIIIFVSLERKKQEYAIRNPKNFSTTICVMHLAFRCHLVFGGNRFSLETVSQIPKGAAAQHQRVGVRSETVHLL